MMKRVLVIGCPGLGKSTFSRELSKKTKLPLIPLDLYHHDTSKNYYEDKESWKQRVRELTKQDSWIIDGNYSSTFPERFKRADTIICFDMPRRTAMYGIFKRFWEYRNKTREDMPVDWKERPNWEFIHYVWNFDKKQKPKTEAALEENARKKLIVFKTRKQAYEYLKML